MSHPREIVPGRYYHVVRRCTQREFWLRPEDDIDQILKFCLAVAAKRSGIDLLAWLFMSNHYHLVVYDADGRIPEFVEHLNKSIARALNAHWGRKQNLWDSGRCRITRLATEEDVVDAIVYTLTNPVKAFLVDNVAQWPGVSSWLFMEGKKETVGRPLTFFRRKGSAFASSAPDDVVLKLSQPLFSAERGESMKACAEGIRAAVETRVRQIRAAHPNRKVVGRKAVLATNPLDQPESKEDGRKLNPTLACKDKVLRKALRLSIRGFRAQYRKAFENMRNGKDARYPYGTYRLVKLGVPIQVDPPPKLTKSA